MVNAALAEDREGSGQRDQPDLLHFESHRGNGEEVRGHREGNREYVQDLLDSYGRVSKELMEIEGSFDRLVRAKYQWLLEQLTHK